MPVEQYIQTKLPKARLPFREMQSGGLAYMLGEPTYMNRPGYSSGLLVKLAKLLKGKKKTNAEILEEILKNIRKDTSPPRIDMKKLMQGDKPIKVYSGSTIRETNTPDAFAKLAKHVGVSPHRIEKEMLKNQWFTPYEDYARGFTDAKDLTSKMRTVDLLPKEIAMAKRYVDKVNKIETSSMAKKLDLDWRPKHHIDTGDKTVIIPRYKLKELEKSGRMKKDYMILEKLKKKLGLAEGGIARASGGLAYMLGEPTYMKYGAGGSVGHAPWHKPTGQPQPQGQDQSPTPQVGGAQSPGRGQPNPMKAPRGLPSVAPRTMDPAFMQQQMMQKAMMGQGQQRRGMEEGGMIPEQFLEDLKKRDYHEFLDKYRQWQENYERRKDLGVTQEAAQGGRIGLGLGSMSRRAFLKMMAAITGTGVAAGTGLLKLSKAAKVVPKVTETAEVITRGADGMPTYITDLIEVVKGKGTKDIIEGFKKSDYSNVHRYKGVEVIEDGAGNIKIKSEKGGVATDPYTGKSYEGVSQENHMQIDKGEWIKPTKSKKGIKTHDEYIEGTVSPDMDGKMKDFEEGLDEAVHLDFKKIADEVGTLIIRKTKKASGGLAHMLGE